MLKEDRVWTTTAVILLAFAFLTLTFVGVSFISASETEGTLGVDNGGGNVVIGTKGCQEDWSGSTWSQCVDGQQTFICFDRNTCGTTSLKPAQCGDTRACDTTTTTTTPTSSGGGGGGGGGASGGSSGGGGGGIVTLNTQNSDGEDACVENWECGEWSNTEEMCGKRTCIDKNSCGTTELKPITADSCPNIFTSFFSFLTGGVLGGVEGSAKEGRGTILAVLLVLIALGVGIVLFRRQSKTNERIRKRGY